MSVDPAKATAFDSIPEFEAIATIPGEGGISIYRRKCFVLNREHQASALSVDALTSMSYHVVAASPNPDGSAADLDLTMVAVAALSHPGSPEEKRRKARQALLRAVCEHLLLTTTTDGTPFGGLRHQHDLIIFPRQGASPAIPASLPGVSNELNHDLHANEGPNHKRTLGDRDQEDLNSIVGSLRAGSEIGSLSETSLSTDASLRTLVTPIKQFDILWSQFLALTPELGKAQSKDPGEAVVDIAQARFLLGELDLVAQDTALHGERVVIQELSTGLSHVLIYKKPGLACAFHHRRLHSVSSIKQARLLTKVQDDLRDITAVGGKQDFPTLAD